MKSWAKRLADNNTSVDNIASKFSSDNAITSETIRSWLGEDYLKQWVKKLADDGKSVSSISTITGKSTATIISWLGNTYLKSIAIDMANNGKTMSAISTHIGKTASETQKLLGTKFLYEWALRLAEENTKFTTICSNLGYSSNTDYVRNTLLKTQYNSTNKTTYSGGYNTVWVWKLDDAGKNTEVTSITGLASADVTKYRNERNDAKNKTDALNKAMNDGKKALSDALGTTNDKEKAKKMANENKSIKDIATALKQTESIIRSWLGDSYMKGWAKRLADDNTSVPDISKKFSSNGAITEAQIRGNYLGTAYMKRWAKRLADADTSVVDIIKKFTSGSEFSSSNIRGTYLGTTYVKSWVLRLANKDVSISDIAKKLDFTQSDAKGYMTANDRSNWAVRLADTDNYTVSQISKYIGNEVDTTRNKSLGTIYNKIHGTSYSGGYITIWVWRLVDKKVSDADIRSKLGISPEDLKKYKEEKTEGENDRSNTKNNLKQNNKSMQNVKSNPDKDYGNKLTAYGYANDGNNKHTIAWIAKQFNKSADVIRNWILEIDSNILRKWAKRLADDNTYVPDISNILSDSNTNVRKELLGADYVKIWAKKLIDDGETDLQNVKTILGSDLANDTLRNTYVEMEYLAKLATKLAENGKAIGDIAKLLLYGSNTSSVKKNIFEGDYFKYLSKTYGYYIVWVGDLIKKGKTDSQIQNITGLDSKELKECKGKLYTRPKNQSDAQKDIENGKSDIGGNEKNIAIMKLARLGTRLENIQKSNSVLKAFGKSNVTASDVRGEMSKSNKMTWAQAMFANNVNITINDIGSDLGLGNDLSTVRTDYLTKAILLEAAHNMAENGEIYANIKKAIGSDLIDKTFRNTYINGASNNVDYEREWALRLVNGQKKLSVIAQTLGYSKYADLTDSKIIKDTDIENYLFNLMNLKKTITQIHDDYLDKISEDDIKNLIKSNETKCRNWIKALIVKSGDVKDYNYYNISELKTRTGFKESDLQSYLTNNFFGPWIKYLAKRKNTMATIKNKTSYSDAKIYSLMESTRYKSWVRAMARSKDSSSKYKKAETVITELGYLYTSSSSTATITSASSVKKNHVEMLCNIMGKVYVADWVKKISETNKENDSTISSSYFKSYYTATEIGNLKKYNTDILN